MYNYVNGSFYACELLEVEHGIRSGSERLLTLRMVAFNIIPPGPLSFT